VKKRDDFIMDMIALYLKENYMKNITLTKILNIACMNRNKFCRAFKQRFGQSLVTYLNGLRARRAAEMLRNPDLSITEIAHHVGFESVTHFNRVFGKINRLCPREYRKNYGELKSRFNLKETSQ
jgi:AraC-like DNA-binding protein